MRDEDRVRILHMIDAAEAAAQFLNGRSRDDLDQDRMLLFSLVHAIEILGEAANKLSLDARAAAPQVSWGAIVAPGAAIALYKASNFCGHPNCSRAYYLRQHTQTRA